MTLHTDHESYGDWLRRARAAAGLTQEALAEMAGLGSGHTISRIETGKRRHVRLRTRQVLQQALEAERQKSVVVRLFNILTDVVKVHNQMLLEGCPLPAGWHQVLYRSQQELALRRSSEQAWPEPPPLHLRVLRG